MITISETKSVVNGRFIVSATCDDATDVANLSSFGTENYLQMGSECYCVATGNTYVMKNDFSWVAK